jgi:hypothetical protein
LWYLFNIPSIADPLPTLLTVLVLQMLNGSSAAVEKSFRTKYIRKDRYPKEKPVV